MDPASAIDNDENLQVLRRLDPELEEVLATAAHVCLYYMHISTQQWTRKNVEGSLFLLKRRKAPRFQMMVLNKLATENYYETIHGSFDFEVNAPYLMYTHGNSEIHGIWFYDQEDLNRLFTLLNRIKSGLPKTDILPTAAPSQAPEAAAPGTDTAFWDKRVDVSSSKAVPVKPDMQAPAEVSSVQPAAQNLTALLKQAHLKQQQQHAAAPPTQPAQVDAAAPLLTPSFFQSQSSGAAPQPAPAPKQAPAAKPQEAAGTQPTPDNALHKLFAKAAASPSSLQSAASQPLPSGGQGPVPVAAMLAANAKKKAAPVPTTAAQPQQGDALAKLFSSASSRAPAVTAPGPAVAPAGAAPRQGPAGQSVRDRVRQAMTQLLANDAFVDMISEQFKAAGLLSE